MKQIFSYSCVFIFLFSFIFGEENNEFLKNKIDNLSSKIEKLDNFLSDMEISLDFTNVVQNIHNVNLPLDQTSNNRKSPIISSYSVELEISKTFDKKNKMFMELETGEGSIDNNLNLFSGINDSSNDGDGSFRFSKIYLEHTFLDGFFMNIGKLSASDAMDQNTFADDEKMQFLSSIFVNSLALDFPLEESFGLQFFYEKEFYDISIQYLDATGDSNNDLTKNMFSSFQFNLKPFKMSGNYRFYIWHNSSLYNKNDNKIYDNYGYGISFDQKLSDRMGLFLRYGYNNDKVIFFDSDYKIDKTFSLGLTLNQKLLSDNDFLGIAYGELEPNKVFDLSKEKHLEVFYNLHVSDFLSISPDFQYIKNPFGYDRDKDIFVYGIRSSVNF